VLVNILPFSALEPLELSSLYLERNTTGPNATLAGGVLPQTFQTERSRESKSLGTDRHVPEVETKHQVPRVRPLPPHLPSSSFVDIARRGLFISGVDREKKDRPLWIFLPNTKNLPPANRNRSLRVLGFLPIIDCPNLPRDIAFRIEPVPSICEIQEGCCLSKGHPKHSIGKSTYD